MSADTSSLADALALAFGHGPLAGTTPAFIATREGVTFTRRLLGLRRRRSVALEARAGTLDACDERIARQVLRLWPELEEAAEWL